MPATEVLAKADASGLHVLGVWTALGDAQGWWYGSLGGIAPGDIVVRTQSYWHAMPVSAVVDKHGKNIDYGT